MTPGAQRPHSKTRPRSTFLCFDPRDAEPVEAFVRKHREVLGTVRSVGVTGGDTVSHAMDERFIIAEIRRRYIAEANLALVLVGDRTWRRRFVDWEVAASATHGCAMLALPVCPRPPAIPARVRLLAEENRAMIRDRPPTDAKELAAWIQTAMDLRLSRQQIGRALRTPLMQRDVARRQR